MLDRLPRIWRHLLIQTIAVLLAWAGSDVVPWLKDRPEAWAMVGGILLGQLLLVVTPLVRYLDSGDAARHVDQGSVRVPLMAAAAFAFVTLLVVAALAAPAVARPRPMPYVGVTDARACRGVLMTWFRSEELGDPHASLRLWRYTPDDGVSFRAEGLFYGAWTGHTGSAWLTLEGQGSGGEHALRWPVGARGLPSLVRVVNVSAGVASEGAPIESRCSL